MNKNPKIYFISDLHLKLNRDRSTIEIKEKVKRFIGSLPDDTTRLVMIGDIFDFWYEWYHVIPAYHFDFLYALRKLIDKGIRVTYIPGNHDFNLGTYLSREVGIECTGDDLVLNEDGKKILVTHGDGLAASDHGYRFLKKVLKSPVSNFLFRTFIPPDLGVKLAELSSGSSRNLRSIDRSKWKKEYLTWAENKMTEGYDHVIMGHLHHPEIINTGHGTYLNTGDWRKHFTYGLFTNGALTLEKFDG